MALCCWASNRRTPTCSTICATLEGLNTDELSGLPLRGLSRMAIQSRYPLDATPPSELFDPADAEQALTTAAAVIDILEAIDQQG